MNTLGNRLRNSVRHEAYIAALRNPKIPLVIATGPAGTGKTKLACNVGLEQLTDNHYERLVITRPTVSVGGEDIGFLPGDMTDKLYPWLSHMMEYVDMYNLRFVQSKIDMMSLSYIRGETWHNKWIIADEMQNSTPLQMKTLLTRVGENTKLVITGDLSQCDTNDPNNGLYDLMQRLNVGSDMVESVEFTVDDIRRSEFVKHILSLYQS